MSSPAREASTRSKLEFLSCPATYSGQRQAVEVIETHFAWVFLTEQHAYKMKKPLHQDAMDYRSIARRGRGCRNELRLNRRLAASVYLEVVPLGCRADGSLVLGPGRRTVDWLVKMRRLPAARMLDRLIADGTVSARERSALIDLLATFYVKAQPRAMRPAEYVQALRTRIDENLGALSGVDLQASRGTLLQVIQQQRRYVDLNVELLHARAGRLVDAHGDLRPEHICLGSQQNAACVIDCLEFDSRLRRLDPLEELAFLALECRRLGAEKLGNVLARGVQVAIGEVAPASLTAFYESQRALTRAKLSAWHLRDVQRARRRHWLERADSYVRDALHFADRALSGLPAKVRKYNSMAAPARAAG